MKTVKEILNSNQIKFGESFLDSESEKQKFKEWAEEFLSSDKGREMLLFIDDYTSIDAIKDKKGYIIRAQKSPNFVNWILEYPKR